MGTMSHRELRNNSAEVLRAVRAGETIEVTNHGEVAAVLVAPSLTPYAAGAERCGPATSVAGPHLLPVPVGIRVTVLVYFSCLRPLELELGGLDVRAAGDQ
jgi:prevent-host-death family protein